MNDQDPFRRAGDEVILYMQQYELLPLDDYRDDNLHPEAELQYLLAVGDALCWLVAEASGRRGSNISIWGVGNAACACLAETMIYTDDMIDTDLDQLEALAQQITDDIWPVIATTAGVLERNPAIDQSDLWSLIARLLNRIAWRMPMRSRRERSCGTTSEERSTRLP